MPMTEIMAFCTFSPLKDRTLEKYTPQTKAEIKLLQTVAIIKPQLSLQVVLITGKAIRHSMVETIPALMLFSHTL